MASLLGLQPVIGCTVGTYYRLNLLIEYKIILTCVNESKNYQQENMKKWDGRLKHKEKKLLTLLDFQYFI